MSTTTTEAPTIEGRPLADQSYELGHKLSQASIYLHRLYEELSTQPLDEQTLASLEDKFARVTESVEAFEVELESVKAARRRRAGEILTKVGQGLRNGDAPNFGAPELGWAARMAGVPVAIANDTDLPF